MTTCHQGNPEKGFRGLNDMDYAADTQTEPADRLYMG